MEQCFSLALITPPVSEPLTLAEAKAHVRQDGTDDDTLLTSLITAVRTYAESVYGCVFMTQTWTMYLDHFPHWEIEIPKRPLQSIDSIKYYDSGGALQTLSSSLYSVDATSFLGVVTPVYGGSWPVTRYQNKAVQVQFKVGWGDVQGVLPASDEYVVGNTPSWNTSVAISAKTATQFTLNFGTAAPASATVDWSAQSSTTPIQIYRGTKVVVEDALTVDVLLGVPVLLSYVVGGIPEHLRRGLLLLLSELYEHREPNIIGVSSSRLELTTKLLFTSDRVMPV